MWNITKHEKFIWFIYFIKYLFSKMGKKTLTFDNIETEKNKLYRHNTPIFWDIKIVLLSKKIYFRETNYKYFIGYLFDNHKAKPLHIMLTKTTAYVKCNDGQTKWMYFLIEDDDLLEIYNTIWYKYKSGLISK